MSLSSLVPRNTQKAREAGVSAFSKFLAEEDLTLDYVKGCIVSDASGGYLVTVMDRFGVYLAYSEGKSGLLARNSVMSYFRQVKNWLLALHPRLREPTDALLLKQARTLEKHCMKREGGGYISKAPACTKPDLSSLMRYVFCTAMCGNDYQDGALLCLMWHCFGRASDLSFVQKQHLSVSPDGSFFLRLLRVKTSQEQGLTLVPDKNDFLTCPLHALAVALVMQDAPCAALLAQLPAIRPTAVAAPDAGAPLLELLNADPRMSAAEASTAARPAGGEEGVHAYINRVLRRVAKASGAAPDLTSHSFRRGGAQHANGEDRLAAQWIFDRGAWNLSTTNKGFAYVFNTPREDRKIARVLSGWEPDAAPPLVSSAGFDSSSQAKLKVMQRLLFAACSGMADPRLNVPEKVLGVLVAQLVRYFPLLKALAKDAPVVRRVEHCAEQARVPIDELLAWSVALNEHPHAITESKDNNQPPQEQGRSFDHDRTVIRELIDLNRKLEVLRPGFWHSLEASLGPTLTRATSILDDYAMRASSVRQVGVRPIMMIGRRALIGPCHVSRMSGW